MYETLRINRFVDCLLRPLPSTEADLTPQLKELEIQLDAADEVRASLTEKTESLRLEVHQHESERSKLVAKCQEYESERSQLLAKCQEYQVSSL